MNKDYKSCILSELMVLIKNTRRLKVTSHNIKIASSKLQILHRICTNSLNYYDVQNVNIFCKSICDQRNHRANLAAKRTEELQETERILDRIDQLHLKFAKRAAPFNNGMEVAKEYQCDMFLVHSMDEIPGIDCNQDQVKKWVDDTDKEFDAIVALMQEVQRIYEELSLTSRLR